MSSTPSRPTLVIRDNMKSTANAYYRIDVVYRTLKALGVADCYSLNDSTFRTEEQLAELVAKAGTADMYLQYQTGGSYVRSFMRAMRRVGDTAYFVTLDDDIHHVSPLNPQFRILGWKAPDGRALRKGETIWFADERTGERWPIWRDGEEGFDVARNRRGLKALEAIMRNADGVICTTERLANAYRERLGLEHVYVFPNSVIEADFPRIALAKAPGVVRVLWQGGQSHYEDWYGAKDMIASAIKAFPETRLVVWGDFWKGVHGLIPEAQREHHEVVPYDAFKIKLAALDFDINLAPLSASMFNLSKSCIKWYEASVLPEPKPTLAARVPPYSDEIVDDETGFLYSTPEEFAAKFEALVRSKALRLRLARNAREWVLANRAAEVTVPRLWEWMLERREARRERQSGRLKRLRAKCA